MMEVTWVGCDYGNEPHQRIDPVGVFVHWIVGTQASCDATFNRPGRYASTTYSVAEDQVHQYVEEGYATWHCGASQNYTHMSIELEGWEGHPPTDGTMDTCAQLIADMSRRWGWGKLVHTSPDDPACNVWEHNWVAATSCPGETDVDEIVRRANVILGYEEDDMALTDNDVERIADAVFWRVMGYKNEKMNGTKDVYQLITDAAQTSEKVSKQVTAANVSIAAHRKKMER